MADRTISDSRRNLSVTTPQPISKDVLGSDNPIPLSPQWLLPKPGEGKPGMGTGENHLNPYPNNGSRSEATKLPGISEERHDTHKSDVFRPSLLDMETGGRRDRWRDEERDTNSSIRKDRWVEGDKELGDTRKIDRWTENSSARQFGEARRATSEGWSDSSNRENNFEQRRESKWNTRWGPEDKEKDSSREKWVNSGREGDTPLDKGMSQVNSNAKDEREGDHYRPWRLNSSQNRGRGEPHHHQTLTPNKHGPMFPYGRGRGENAPPTFSLGRGRVNYSGNSSNSFSAHSQSLGMISDKGESIHGEPSLLRYSRTKLLDIYRTTDMRSSWKLLDGFVQVSYLTQEESLEPLALSAPIPEELVILKGIDKGEIVSSGAPQISKDGSVGRNSLDFVQSRQSKLGSKEDIALVPDDCKDEGAENSKGGYSNYLEGSLRKALRSNLKMETMQDHQMHPDNQLNLEVLRDDTAPYRRADEVPTKRGSSMQGNSSVLVGDTWRSPSIGERSHAASHDVRSSTSEMGWSQPMKDPNEWQGSLANSSYPKNELKWQVGEDPSIKKLPPGIANREHESRKVPPPSPEDLVLYYKDPQGEIQGPFSGSDIIGWFEAGYFGIDLQVRVASAPNNSLFSLLGDVMPHLRAKGGPPPGFTSPKQNETTDAPRRPSFGSFGKIHGGLSEIDIVKNEPINLHGSATIAENRFLESLMSANLTSSSPLEKFAFSEGLQGYIGNNSSGVPPVGVESGNNLYLLAKKMELERQKSLPSPHPYWPGRDAASMVLKPEIVSGSPALHSKLLPSMSNNLLQQPQSQNADMMAILQGLSDRSSTGVNNSVTSWSNFPVQGGVEPLQDRLELHNGQNFPPQAALGIQPQRLQPQNQPSLTNLLAQTIDNSSGISTTEKLLSSGLSQDPQLLSVLQQQYLLQLHSQAPVPTQLSMLDRLLLLKQQQKQEEEQQVMRQQQLLSQVLLEHHSLQRYGEPSYGQLPATAIPAGNASVEHPQLPPLQDSFQIGSNIPVTNMQDDRNINFPNLPSQVSQDVNFSFEATSLHLPHQMFGNATRQKSWGTTVPEQTIENQHKEGLFLSAINDGSQSFEAMDTSSQDSSVLPKVDQTSDYASLALKDTLQKTSRTNDTITVRGSGAISESLPSKSPALDATPSLGTCEDKLLTPELAIDVKIKPDGSFEEQHIGRSRCTDAPSSTEALENVEVREVRKASDKKSRKQKTSKTHSTLDQAKEVSKIPLQQNKQSEIEEINVGDSAFETHMDTGETYYGTSPQNATYGKFGFSAVDSQLTKSSLPASLTGDDVESVNIKGVPNVESVSQPNKQGQSGQRAWKPAPGFKAKSLLEIQQEEQRKAQTATAVSEVTSSINPIILPGPWVGVVANADIKSFRGNHQDAEGPELVLGISDNSLSSKSKKSQLHDLLAEEVLAKSSEKYMEVIDSTCSLPPQPVDNENFIEAKDTKKNRKKSAKAKGGAKVSLPVASVDLSVGSSLIDKGKSTRHVQQEKEVLPALPSGPSLGDFVVWKGETANAATAPAWLNDSGKLPKPTSLRDILKEQEKKVSSVQHQSQMLTPQKSQSIQVTHGSVPLWSLPESFPSKAASPMQINSNASAHSKYKGDDDLFWGAIDQPKLEAKQVAFPQLISQGSRGTKNTPVKGTPGGSLSRQKSVSGRPAEHSLSSSPASAQSSLKGKRDAMTKHSEAMDFRDWCVSESARLTGTNDTSFLEFCLKQSRTEAAILLRENLGSFDPDHEFIDKFLNFKELLPADVLEIAFQSGNDHKVTSFGAGDATSDNAGFADFDRDIGAGTDGSTKGGSKKKGKKGKKVSPSVLGFNVVSNRIMMGEIQTPED